VKADIEIVIYRRLNVWWVWRLSAIVHALTRTLVKKNVSNATSETIRNVLDRIQRYVLLQRLNALKRGGGKTDFATESFESLVAAITAHEFR
jgi:hypothetical protein